MTKEKELDNPHDKGYKFLLSSEKIFLELIESFVDKGWVEKIDSTAMTRIDKSYILQDFDEKEADLVYRLKIKGQDVIFYILMELQSTVDFQMPYRLLLYMVEIWRDILRNTSKDEATRKDFRLPSIVPIVLYNGENNWTASTSFKETLSEYEMFGEYVLNFKYILLDVNRYSKEKLLDMSNLISTVFLFDQSINGNEFYKRLIDAIEIIKRFTQEEFQIFKVWFNNIASRELPQEVKEEVKGIIDSTRLEEVDTMVYNIEKIFGKVKTEGIEEGIEKVARNMLQKNVPDNIIAEFTGMLIENIEKLKKEIGLSTK